jgi:hypothetical protein
MITASYFVNSLYDFSNRRTGLVGAHLLLHIQASDENQSNGATYRITETILKNKIII